MKLQVLDKAEISPLVEALMEDYRVVAPHAKGSKFTFETVTDPANLRLDYDTTILPPKKVLQPTKDRLATFTLGEIPQIEDVLEVTPTVVFGTHTCDLKGIQLLDEVFSRDFDDTKYTAQRKETFLVSVECLSPCDEHAFCKDMGTMTANEGFDLHLTELDDVYAVDAGTEAGEELLAKYGSAREATEAEKQELNQKLGAKWPKFNYKLNFEAAKLPAMLETAFDHPIWDDMGERCLACGSCTTVCPTCYCFNVVDEVDMLLTQGTRERYWDSCQLEEFAAVAGGENFREGRAARQRHRLMRKGKYIYEKFDELGCVGCGRCVRTCVAKISIVESFNTIHNGRK